MTKSPGRLSSKAFWFALHGWFALPIWGLLALICITGTIATLSEEITWLINPEVRASNKAQTEPLPYSSLIAAAKKSYPGAQIQSIKFTQPYIASLVRVSRADGETKLLHVNQYTGNIQGEVTSSGFRGFIVALHGWLLFPWNEDYSFGWYLVTALSIPLLGSIISGIIIFKHFYRLILRPKLRVSMGSRVFWGDLHRLIAAWSIWFAIIISVSGLWFLIQGVLDQNHVKIYPDKIQLSATYVKPENTNSDIAIDDIIANTNKQFPYLQITYIEFPANSSDTLMIQGKKRFSLLRDHANTININPYDGSVVAIRSGSDLSPIHFTSALLTPLHFGDFAGLTSKIIWFLFGCLMSVLVCSGFIIWSKRTFHAHQKLALRPNQLKLNKRNKIKRVIFWASWGIIAFPIYFFIQ